MQEPTITVIHTSVFSNIYTIPFPYDIHQIMFKIDKHPKRGCQAFNVIHNQGIFQTLNEDLLSVMYPFLYKVYRNKMIAIYKQMKEIYYDKLNNIIHNGNYQLMNNADQDYETYALIDEASKEKDIVSNVINSILNLI